MGDKLIVGSAVVGIIAGVLALVFLGYMLLGWLAQKVYVAFAPTDWPHPGYWMFVLAVFVLSAIFGGGGAASRRS